MSEQKSIPDDAEHDIVLTELSRRLILETINKTPYLGRDAEVVADTKLQLSIDDDEKEPDELESDESDTDSNVRKIS